MYFALNGSPPIVVDLNRMKYFHHMEFLISVQVPFIYPNHFGSYIINKTEFSLDLDIKAS